MVFLLWLTFLQISKSFVHSRPFTIATEAALHKCSCKKVLWKCAVYYMWTLMPKCDFNKVAKQLNWNHTLAWVFSCKSCCIFSEYLFLRTPLGGCFCSKFIRFLKIWVQYSLQLTDTLKGGHLWLADNFFFTGWILVKVS